MKINLNFYFANLFFICALFPFVSPIPVGSDTQPTIMFPAIVLILIYLNYQHVKTNYIEIIFLITALISLFYINIDSGEFILKKRMGLLFSFIVFIVSRRFYHLFSYKVFKYSIIIHCLLVVFHYIEPQLFNTIFSFLIRKLKILSMSGARGASGLAPEPGFAGALGVFYLCLLLFFNKKHKISKIDNFFLSSVVIISVLLTKSGTGYLYLLVFFIFWFLKNMNRIYVIPMMLMMFVVLVYSSQVPNRGMQTLIKLAENPLVILNDRSAAHRVYSLNISVLSLLEKPLGAGSGMFSEQAKYFHKKYGLDEFYPAFREEYFSTVSSMGRYFVENGILFLIFLIILFSHSNWNIYNLTLRSTALMYMVASLSIAFPPTWILLAITDKKKCSKKSWSMAPGARLVAT